MTPDQVYEELKLEETKNKMKETNQRQILF